MMKIGIVIILIVAAAAIFGVVGFILGGQNRKRVAEKAIGSAEDEAKRILSNALTTAENNKREKILEARDEIHKERTEYEKEIKERRSEVQRQERRLVQKEENLDKKTDAIEKKEEALNKKLKDAEKKVEEAEALKKSQFDMLEKISGFTKEQAKDYIIRNLEGDLDHEKALKIMEFTQRTKEESDSLAKEIIATAIQRCAADHAASSAARAATSVPLKT